MRYWRKANPEKARAIEVRRRAANQKRNAEWRRKNAQRDVARKAEWYAANSDKSRKRTAEWARRHPERAASHAAKRRARIAAVPLAAHEQADVIALYAKARALTELTGESYHVDHIKPLAKGGLHHPSNLQVLKGIDNLRKGTRV